MGFSSMPRFAPHRLMGRPHRLAETPSHRDTGALQLRAPPDGGVAGHYRCETTPPRQAPGWRVRHAALVCHPSRPAQACAGVKCASPCSRFRLVGSEVDLRRLGHALTCAISRTRNREETRSKADWASEGTPSHLTPDTRRRPRRSAERAAGDPEEAVFADRENSGRTHAHAARLRAHAQHPI